MIDQLKDEVQQEAHRIWLGSGARGTIAAGTGFGKSRIAVLEVARLDAEGLLTDPDDVLLVTPTEKLRDENWPAEFERWGYRHLFDQYVKAICFASMKKEDGEKKRYKLGIFDEIHRLTELSATAFKETDENFLVDFIADNLLDATLGLTATIPDKERDPEKYVIIGKIAPVIFNYTLDQGVADGMIRDYEIRVIYCALGTEKNIEAGSAKKKFMTSEEKNYEYMEKEIRKFRALSNSPATRAMAEKMIQIKQMARNRFLGTAASKTKVAKRCLQLLAEEKGKRLLVFCGGIDQCEELMSPNTYHSKRNSDAYDAFCQLESDWLGVVDAVNEGVNFPDLDFSLITRINSNGRVLVQRIGRNLRIRPGMGPEDKAIIYILILRNTAEERWLADCLEYFDKSKVTYYDAKSFM